MAQLGNERRAYLVETSTHSWLEGEQSNTLNLTSEAIEVSDKSTVWQQFIAGKRGATAEITVHTDNSSSKKQHVFMSALHKGAKVKVYIGVLGSNSDTTDGDLFEALVSAISDTNEVGSVASRSMSLTVTGPVTHFPTIS